MHPDVNQDGTNCCCMQSCNLACTDLAMNPNRTPEQGQSGLLFGSESLAEKSERE